jgi:hypothetical protein
MINNMGKIHRIRRLIFTWLVPNMACIEEKQQNKLEEKEKYSI